jgi:hypothetical protein
MDRQPGPSYGTWDIQSVNYSTKMMSAVTQTRQTQTYQERPVVAKGSIVKYLKASHSSFIHSFSDTYEKEFRTAFSLVGGLETVGDTGREEPEISGSLQV